MHDHDERAARARPRHRPASRRASNGINVIAESERKGTPAGLFWPWCASNISVLAVAYGAFVLGFGIGLWQALVAGVGGCRRLASCWSGWSRSRASEARPRRWCSRARRSGAGATRLPALVSYLLLVGWETVLVALSTLATATVFEPARLGARQRHQGPRLRGRGGDDRRSPGLGLRPDHAAAEVLTLAMIAITVVYVVLAVDHINLSTARALPPAPRSAVDRCARSW